MSSQLDYIRWTANCMYCSCLVHRKKSFVLHFKGMEISCALVKKCASMTVIASGSVPFQQTFPPEIGQAIHNVWLRCKFKQ